MKLYLITEGICTGMKVLEFGNNSIYYSGHLSDEYILHKFANPPLADSSTIQFDFLPETSPPKTQSLVHS